MTAIFHGMVSGGRLPGVVRSLSSDGAPAQRIATTTGRGRAPLRYCEFAQFGSVFKSINQISNLKYDASIANTYRSYNKRENDFI